MARVNLIFTALLDRNGNGQMHVGGVETYILRLSRLITEMGHEPILYQQAARAFTIRVEGLTVVGVPPSTASVRRLHDMACHQDPDPNPVILFCADQISCRAKTKRSILVQNGVYWDLPNRYWVNHRAQSWPVLRTLSKFYTTLCKRRDLGHAVHRVSVDLNFINWYRTICDSPDESTLYHIPNCCTPLTEAEARDKTSSVGGPRQILFARRFYDYRGTRVFGEAAAKLLENFNAVRLVIAGEGPDEPYFRRIFNGKPGVMIQKIEWSRMPGVLRDSHISVVPSLGSEGTALTLAESMGAACAVVASNVGGMTNMVIDGHNGLLIWPRTEDCYQALRLLLEDPQLLRRLAFNAWQTAADSFSEREWNHKWRVVLSRCIGE